jgi:tetratricopeptide (TPR) repeat protein
VFTTREPLPAPFDARGRERELGALDRADAIELVSQVMAQEGLVPESSDPGRTPQEIVDLVEAVHCHARALVLLAREVARRGVKATTDNLRALMADLEHKHPGDRENSLYASVELSLRRLPPASRQHTKVLAVCQGGIHLAILGMLTGLEPDAARQLASELIEVGLGEDMGGGHLRLDPGLPPYLLGELTAGEADALRSRWAEAMAQLTGYLYQDQDKNAHVAAHLTRLELPNLLAMLELVSAALPPAPSESLFGVGSAPASGAGFSALAKPSTGAASRSARAPTGAAEAAALPAWPPERVVDLAQEVEQLVANLGQPQVLAVATRVREQAAQHLGNWSHARSTTESATIERLLERGDLPGAHEVAQRLLNKCRAAGETAYPEAAYDLAGAYLRLGCVLERGGAAEDALAPLAEAQRRFQQLADAGNASAEGMAAATINFTGNCLMDLGRLDEAAATYEEVIKRHRVTNRQRDIATAKFQLGTVLLRQKRHAAALEIYGEARDTFAALGEPRMVATAWHQIGMVHEEAGQFEPAEQAYRQSLAIKVRENDLAGQAPSLGQLGNVYGATGRLEEAVTFLRQCAEICVRLNDQAKEGVARSNLAIRLVQLRRYDDARQELQRAIECNQPYGHAAEPWKTWAILEHLERATGHAAAAQAARQQAFQTYLAYRRTGGVSQSNRAQLFELVARTIQQNQPREAGETLSQFAAHPQAPPDLKALIAKLQSILAGDRTAALAADPVVHYFDAAELHLLLEQLSPR